jgi:predicted ferric reductase
LTPARAAAALGAYVAVSCVPLAIAAAPPRTPGRPFWIDAAVGLGFVALGQVAAQFGLIARIRPMSRPFGIDLVMQFHRRMGGLAIALAAVHGIVLFARRPGFVALLDPSRAGWGTLAGLSSLLLLGTLAALSVFRKEIGLGYEAWRVSHAALSIAALATAQIHVSLSGVYLGASWKHAALACWSGAFVAFVVHLRLVMPALLRRRPWAVTGVRPEPGATWVVALEPVGHPGMRFAPGQFAWLKLGRSAWSPEEHPFSFCSSADDPGRIELAIKELGDFTRRVGGTPVGTRAYLDGPHGSFSTDFAPAPGYLFVAGGIGISPILSMLRTLAARKDPRSHALVYASSRWERTAFREELEELPRALRLEVVHVLEHPPEGWAGATGFITREILAGALARTTGPAAAFVCGPDAMMTSVARGLRACGVPPRRIHMERFQLV